MRYFALSRFLSALALIMLSGCATLFGSDTDEVTFESEPAGATVYLNDKKIGVTPVKMTLSRKTETTTASFSKDGYSTQKFDLSRNIAGAAWFNLGFVSTTFGAPSWGLDAATGKLLRYSPDAYVVQLQRTGTASTDDRSGQTLAYTLANFEGLRHELVAKRGESFAALCKTYQMNSAQCGAFYSKLQTRKAELVSTQSALAWYRDVNAVAQGSL